MEIFTYGITTSRYQSSILWDKDRVITPIGSNLSIWNLETLTREKVFQYNTNAVMSIIQNSNFIFSVAFNSEVVILDKLSLSVVATIKAEGKCVNSC